MEFTGWGTMGCMDELKRFRDDIDTIDSEIMRLFGERFRVTEQVGRYKAAQGLPSTDSAREAAQMERIAALAEENGVDPAFARQLLRLTIDRVVATHDKLRAGS